MANSVSEGAVTLKKLEKAAIMEDGEEGISRRPRNFGLPGKLDECG